MQNITKLKFAKICHPDIYSNKYILDDKTAEYERNVISCNKTEYNELPLKHASHIIIGDKKDDNISNCKEHLAHLILI